MTKAKPFFSITIPSLNEEKFLPRLLTDLSRQTTDKFEVIHVDGASEDQTCPLAKSIAPKLPAFKQIISPVRHVSHQRNLGAKTARGQYLLFIDADTQLPNYFLEGLSYQLHRQPADIFTTWSAPDSDKAADLAVTTVINLGLELVHRLNSPAAIGVLMGCTLSAFNQIGGFDETTTFGEDADFVRTGHQLGLSFVIYRQPQFYYSLRRFRKEGTLKSLQNIAAKRLSWIMSDQKLIKMADYPMGGHIFAGDTTDKAIFDRLDAAIKQFTHRPKLRQYLKDLITFQEVQNQ